MRRDSERLIDILEALQLMAEALNGVERATFLANDMLYAVTAYRLTIVGEAVASLRTELRDRHTEIDWRNIAGLRNALVHRYFGIDRALVWELATVDAVKLREQISRILKEEFPET